MSHSSLGPSLVYEISAAKVPSAHWIPRMIRRNHSRESGKRYNCWCTHRSVLAFARSPDVFAMVGSISMRTSPHHLGNSDYQNAQRWKIRGSWVRRSNSQSLFENNWTWGGYEWYWSTEHCQASSWPHLTLNLRHIPHQSYHHHISYGHKSFVTREVEVLGESAMSWGHHPHQNTRLWSFLI